jgi:hypothetical protein
MKTRTNTLTTVLGMSLAAGAAFGQVADLTVSPNASSLDLEVTISVSGFNIPSSDDSPLSGSVQIELDDYANPTSISLHDFAVLATQTLTLNFNASFFGSATSTLSGAGASYAGTMPTTPVAVDANGVFGIAGVPTSVTGSGVTTASGIFASFNGVEFNLAEFGVFDGLLIGNVQIVGNTVQLIAVIASSGSQTQDGITLNGVATITLVASGEIPAAACPGDIADDFGSLGADDQVSFGDFLALLGLIGPCPGVTPGCTGDIADDFGSLGGDGQVSFGDFLALLGLIGPCA